MKQAGTVLLSVVLALIASYAAVTFSQRPESMTAAGKQESVYDRVMRTKTIRCGYAVWNPSLMKDPATGDMSGIFYDYMEAMAKALELKIEWTEEVSWGDFPAALESGRFDVMCAGVWPNAKRGRFVDYGQPLYYLPFYAYVRADDSRFDNNVEHLNSPEYTLTMTDGETSSITAYTYFPDAKKVELPQLTDISQNFLNVADGKADAYLNDVVSFYEFNEKNPGKLKIIPGARPLKVVANTISFRLGEEKFRRMLNTAALDLINDGTVERILKKYEKFPGGLRRVAAPYEAAP